MHMENEGDENDPSGVLPIIFLNVIHDYICNISSIHSSISQFDRIHKGNAHKRNINFRRLYIISFPIRGSTTTDTKKNVDKKYRIKIAFSHVIIPRTNKKD